MNAPFVLGCWVCSEALGAAKKTGCQVKGFVPIGMLERWNIGKMGFEILECWVTAKVISTKNINGTTSFKEIHYSITPLLHYSITP
jgi:hypothetical protein